MTFYDEYETREVLSIGPSSDYNDQLGITTKYGWCELQHYAKCYSFLPSNEELTTYLKSHYPEYFL